MGGEVESHLILALFGLWYGDHWDSLILYCYLSCNQERMKAGRANDACCDLKLSSHCASTALLVMLGKDVPNIGNIWRHRRCLTDI